jgi:hypothetical protein
MNARDQSTNSADERALQVEYRPLDRLIPYARNARTHSDRQVAEIAASILEFGWTNPILVDGDNGVVAGHGRLLAARKLELNMVPVIELRDMSEAQKRAYILADNRLALNAGWDDAMLAAEVADLSSLGFDLGLAGFEAYEIEKLLDMHRDGDAPSFPDEAPSPPADPVTRPGDLWCLGDHRLLCGDATRPEDLSRGCWRVGWRTWSSPILPTTSPTRARATGGSPTTRWGRSSRPSCGRPAKGCCRSRRARSTSA